MGYIEKPSSVSGSICGANTRRPPRGAPLKAATSTSTTIGQYPADPR
jgi:hypothetical protein